MNSKDDEPISKAIAKRKRTVSKNNGLRLDTDEEPVTYVAKKVRKIQKMTEVCRQKILLILNFLATKMMIMVAIFVILNYEQQWQNVVEFPTKDRKKLSTDKLYQCKWTNSR